MPRKDVRMRLVQNISVRSLLTHPLQQLKIRNESAAAGLNGPIVFHLAWHENMATVAGRTFERRPALLIFADPGLDYQPAKLSGTRDQFAVEAATFDQSLKL